MPEAPSDDRPSAAAIRRARSRYRLNASSMVLAYIAAFLLLILLPELGPAGKLLRDAISALLLVPMLFLEYKLVAPSGKYYWQQLRYTRLDPANVHDRLRALLLNPSNDFKRLALHIVPLLAVWHGVMYVNMRALPNFERGAELLVFILATVSTGFAVWLVSVIWSRVNMAD